MAGISYGKGRVGVLQDKNCRSFESRLLLSTKRWVLTLLRIWFDEIDMMWNIYDVVRW